MRYIAIAILGLALLAGSIWHGTVEAQRINRFVEAISLTGATDPYLDVIDSTTPAQVRIKALNTSAEIGTETNHDLHLVTNSAVEMTILAAGNIGIGTVAPAAGLHGAVTNGLLLWANSETDDTTKLGRWGVEHYDVDEEPFYGIIHNAEVAENKLILGGGSGLGNAAMVVSFHTAANTTTTTGTERMRITSAGDVGIGTTSPAAGLHGVVTNGFLLWANTEADDTDKFGHWGVEHYDVDEEPFYAFRMQTSIITNVLSVGGGSVLQNAATSIGFFTAADNNTTTGTKRMVIDSAGKVGIGTLSPEVGLHGVVTSGAFLWADSEGDDAVKSGRWGIEHYDVDQEPFYAILPEVGVGVNALRLGGGKAEGNAATVIEFYVAANSTTTTGTLVATQTTGALTLTTDLDLGTNYIKIREMAAPGDPGEDGAYIYAVDVAGTTNVCFAFDGGNTVCHADPVP